MGPFEQSDNPVWKVSLYLQDVAVLNSFTVNIPFFLKIGDYVIDIRTSDGYKSIHILGRFRLAIQKIGASGRPHWLRIWHCG